MDNLHELMYRVYKNQRDFISQARLAKMNYNEFLYIKMIRDNCDDYDRINSEFLDRWIKEKEDE